MFDYWRKCAISLFLVRHFVYTYFGKRVNEQAGGVVAAAEGVLLGI